MTLEKISMPHAGRREAGPGRANETECMLVCDARLVARHMAGRWMGEKNAFSFGRHKTAKTGEAFVW